MEWGFDGMDLAGRTGGYRFRQSVFKPNIDSQGRLRLLHYAQNWLTKTDAHGTVVLGNNLISAVCVR